MNRRAQTALAGHPRGSISENCVARDWGPPPGDGSGPADGQVIMGLATQVTHDGGMRKGWRGF